MAGVLAVSGREDCESVARRAAVPLLRRPWHRLELAAAPEDRVALAFAGERGGVASDGETGVLVALDGELVAGAQPARPAAERLLERYLRRGPDFDPGEGSFAAAVWDPRTRALTLVTDRLGTRPLYLTRHGPAVLAAGELKALRAAGLAPGLDLDAWAQLLAYEQMLGEATPLAGVRLVPAASTVTISDDAGESRRERWRYQLEPETDGDEGALVSRFGEVLESAVERLAGERSALALSGGLDSRCLATVVSPDVTAATFGTPGSEDFQSGAAVAGRTGHPHLAIELEPGYLERGAAATVWLSEGQIRCLHAHHLALRSLRADMGLETLMIGYAGDPVLRWGRVPLPSEPSALADALHGQLAAGREGLAELLTPDFAAALAGRARAALARALAEETGDPVSRRNQFCLRQIYRRKVLPGAELFADDLAPRDPYGDRELIEVCRRLPVRFRTDGHLQRAYLRRYPALAGVRSPKDGLPPRLGGARRWLAAQQVRASRRARELAEARLGAAVWPRRRGLGDYSTDLRGESAALLAILLEPRTLARGQLAEQPVRRLVAGTLAGRGRSAQALGMLLTLELFQRQLVDGEEPPPAVADPSAGPGVIRHARDRSLDAATELA